MSNRSKAEILIDEKILDEWSNVLKNVRNVIVHDTSKGTPDLTLLSLAQDIENLSVTMEELKTPFEEPVFNIKKELIKRWIKDINRIKNNIDISRLDFQNVRNDLSVIQKNMKEFLSGSLIIKEKYHISIPEERELPQYKTLREDVVDKNEAISILIGYTLWYGGNNFSLSYNEISVDLNFKRNRILEEQFNFLKRNKVFEKTPSGLVVFNPRYYRLIESSILYLISKGANYSRLASAFKDENKKFTAKQFTTIQDGFLTYSRDRYHPLAHLTSNTYAFILEYCNSVFNQIVKKLHSKKISFPYEILRRFLIRLSLCPLSNFVGSQESDMYKIIDKLETLELIQEVPSMEERILVLRKEVLKKI